MKRFRIITAVCLSAVALMVAGNIWYLYSLYNSIRDQTLITVSECVRRADIREIISRFNRGHKGEDVSSLTIPLKVQGEKSSAGNYEYPRLLDNLSQIMSEYFHIIEKTDNRIAERDGESLNALFKDELSASGLHPDVAIIEPIGSGDASFPGLWSIDFAMSEDQSPIYKVRFSPLHGHILGQMAGIICTSAMILILTGFLIWYLLHWVGRLRSIEQMKDDFTHNMTHELKTPVAVAYSAADSMLRYYDQSDEKRNKQFLQIIMQRLSHLSGMIENILSMSMERFKTMTLIPEKICVKTLVNEVTGMIELKADKPVRIDIDIPDDFSVIADPLHFGNLLSNLMDNSLKYSGDSVNIDIRVVNGAIAVADNGIGIDKADLPYIFDKFYRVSSGDRYETEGYGLGLFYVKQIAGLHGWDIEVMSRPGYGTEFIIRFKDNEER
ncbi:MAG: HAMP domain-containing histidine kinase [Bacteroidales bacterium]|nr:HAMP domain-containing histidine kinase [Bacteroidales bacterium]